MQSDNVSNTPKKPEENPQYPKVDTPDNALPLQK